MVLLLSPCGPGLRRRRSQPRKGSALREPEKEPLPRIFPADCRAWPQPLFPNEKKRTSRKDGSQPEKFPACRDCRRGRLALQARLAKGSRKPLLVLIGTAIPVVGIDGFERTYGLSVFASLNVEMTCFYGLFKLSHYLEKRSGEIHTWDGLISISAKLGWLNKSLQQEGRSCLFGR